MSRSAITPQMAFLGNVFAQVAEFGSEELANIRFAVESLEARMFTGLDLKVYEGVLDVLNEDRLPSPGTVQRLRVPELTLEAAERYREAAAASPSEEWDSYVEGVLLDYRRRVTSETLAAAQKALSEGRVDEALALMSQAEEQAPSRGSYAPEYIESFELTDEDPDPRIPTPFGRLNECLGGGLGFRGRTVMSIWIADSGVGKSTFFQQMIPGFLKMGHRVLYCYGEGEQRDIVQEVARIQAGLSFADLKHNREVPRVIKAYSQAAEELAGFQGRLSVFDREFNGDDVRRLAREHKAALQRDIDAGLANFDAQLIVVVDNVDSAIIHDPRRFPREDQAYGYEARRFEQSAKRDGYHVALLSQTNDEGRRRNGPPEGYDIAFAKVIRNRASHIVTLHRPITEADKTQVDRDGEPGRRAKTWVAVRKSRGGRVDELEFSANGSKGLWADPQEPVVLEAMFE